MITLAARLTLLKVYLTSLLTYKSDLNYSVQVTAELFSSKYINHKSKSLTSILTTRMLFIHSLTVVLHSHRRNGGVSIATICPSTSLSGKVVLLKLQTRINALLRQNISGSRRIVGSNLHTFENVQWN